MISNWFSKGAEVITNSAKSITSSNNTTTVDVNTLTKQILTKIQIKLSKELGQNFEGNLDNINTQIQKQIQLEKTLIQTKQKYNNLVTLSETQNQSVKSMFQSFMQFFKNLCKSLNNDDMLTPLKQLQSAFYVCNTTKVDKQLKYFLKLHDAALNDYLKSRLNSKSEQHKDQITIVKNLNKNLEVQLFRSRTNCVDLEKRLAQVNCRNQQMMEKINILEKLGTQSLVLASNKQKQKAIEKENELLQKIKNLQKQKNRSEKHNKELQNEIKKLSSSIQIIKSNEDTLIEEMKRQIHKKQTSYQHSISKICNQKIHLQDKLRGLQTQLQALTEQIQVLKANEAKSPLKDHHSKTSQIKQLKQKIVQLQQYNQNAKKKMEALVNKDMMKTLFLSYEDQSKQWTIRKDIKNQIYLLLDIKAKKIENKVQEKKWFGIF